MNISNSYFGYLGWNAPEALGVQWIDSSGNLITNSTFIENYRGIDLRGGSNSIVTSNTILTPQTGYGIYIWLDAHNHTVSNNIIHTKKICGIWISTSGTGTYPAYNNNLINNTVYASEAGGTAICITKSYNNNITGGSYKSSSSAYDYYFEDANISNRFYNTDFSAARKIYFVDNASVLEYNNGTSVWLKTQPIISPTAATIITRTLNSWTQTNVSWSETLSAARELKYNISGLLPNTQYDVYNGSIIAYTLTTDANGVLPSFNINFTTSAKTITVSETFFEQIFGNQVIVSNVKWAW